MKTNILLKAISIMLLAVSFTAQAQTYSKITYIHSDADGTPFAATDQQGTIEWQIEHYPYGSEYENTQVARKSDLSFAGKPYDEEIGLSYFGGRWYDPDIGRFTGIDPMPVNPNDYRTFNRYAYGFNNPYKYVDPDGNLPILIPVIVVIGKGLTISGAATSGYAIGSNAYDVYSERKTAGEAVRDGAIEAAAGFALKGAGAGTLKMGQTLASKGGGNNLFRVVDDVELADIQKTGAFRSPAGTLEEGKQFVDNIGDAKALQSKFSKFFGGNQTIVGAKAPQSVLSNSTKKPFADIPKGQAITVPVKDLPKVKPDI